MDWTSQYLVYWRIVSCVIFHTADRLFKTQTKITYISSLVNFDFSVPTGWIPFKDLKDWSWWRRTQIECFEFVIKYNVDAQRNLHPRLHWKRKIWLYQYFQNHTTKFHQEIENNWE
jgi:hypothetical protein